MFSFIKETYVRLIDELDVKTTRYLYPSFEINNRLTGLVGARGVGKTTLLLQYIKQHLYDDARTIYFSADLIYFKQTTLLGFVTDLYQTEGYKIIFIDEIHKYANWNQELKNIYDAFPNIKIIFSGSSMLDLVKGSYDLSRRAKLYHLHGMSFREYLNFVTDDHIAPVGLQELLHKPDHLAKKLVHVERIRGHFQEYLEKGYYPFVFEDKHAYYERITRIIEKTIFEDIANFYDLKTPNLHVFKKILCYLASIPPGELNVNTISQNLSMANQTISHYLTILNDVGLVRLIYPVEGGNQYLRKPQKLLLQNTSLLYALQVYLSNVVDKGMLREVFAMQAFENAGIDLFYSKLGDYRTRDVVFEIGGKNKTKTQVKNSDVPAYLIRDDTVVPTKDVIPLLFLGFLY